jgi:hypothetical protein
MKQTHRLGQQLLACISVISLCLQSCFVEKGRIPIPSVVDQQVSADNDKSASPATDLIFIHMDMERSQEDMQGTAQVTHTYETLEPLVSSFSYAYSTLVSTNTLQQSIQQSEAQRERHVDLSNTRMHQQGYLCVGKNSLMGGRANNNLKKEEESTRQINKRKKGKGHGAVIGRQSCERYQKVENLPEQVGKEKRYQIYKEVSQKSVKRQKLERLEETNKQVKAEGEEQEFMLIDLPVELLENIFSYLSCNSIMAVRQMNRLFYELTTGYSQPGLIGVENKPNRNINIEACVINKRISFKELKSETIPRFPFYQFFKQVYNLPKGFWPYLGKTNIHTVSLLDNPIDQGEVVDFIKNLQGSKVHTVNLNRINLGAELVGELAKYLYATKVHTLNLKQNNL